MPQPSSHREDDVRPDALVKVIKKEPKDTGLKNIQVKPENYKKFEGDATHAPLPRGLIWGVVGLVVLFIGGFTISFYAFRSHVKSEITANIATLQAGVADLQNLNPGSAQQEFSSLGNVSSSDLGSLMNEFGFLFSGGKAALASFTQLSGELATLSNEMNGLQTSGFDLVSQGNGSIFVSQLQAVQGTLAAIDTTSAQLSGVASFTGNFYLSLRGQLADAENALNAFVPWLANPAPHHLLVLLDNPSEIRPGGGFLGSYADLTIASGSITNLSVHDIADADTAFTTNVVPPTPLQLEVTRWRPADANWFFDFPTSASKTIEFFEASSLYAKSSTTFDGVIAVTPDVVSDLLSITGPIAIGKPTTTFTTDNFLVQIQKIVQAGQATAATYPKQILRDLSGAIITQLASSTDAQKTQLLAMAENWVGNREVMAYFKDATLESFATEYGADGGVYALPQKFNGDYLSVVDANVNGGKSDLYVSSTVAYDAEINADATLTDNVSITREHDGNASPYSWYRTTNQDYLQLFVPNGSVLSYETGGAAKKIVPQINYARSGYLVDPTVEAIESTTQTLFDYPAVTQHEESGKEVLASWATVAVGKTTKLTFSYNHRMFLPPAPGVQYQFVFEKQAGTSRNYSIEIDAPLGYEFAENGLPTFTYQSGNLPGRLTVDLTLAKIAE